MATAFSPTKLELSNINNGHRFVAGDGVTSEAINAPIEAVAYLQNQLNLVTRRLHLQVLNQPNNPGSQTTSTWFTVKVPLYLAADPKTYVGAANNDYAVIGYDGNDDVLLVVQLSSGIHYVADSYSISSRPL